MIDNLQEIIDRAIAGTLTPEDKHTLSALRSGQETVASGQRSVAIGGDVAGANIFSGDNIIHISQKLNLSVKELSQLLQQSDFSPSATVSSTKQNLYSLEKIDLDIKEISFVNSRLDTLRELQKNRQLYDEEIEELALLQQKIEMVNTFDNQLKEIEKIAEGILERTITALSLKIEELSRHSGHLLDVKKDALDQKVDCLERQLELVNKFRTQLSFGRQGSEWLSPNITSFAKRIGKNALNQYPELKKDLSDDLIDDFYFSIEQLLERVSHCLLWGRYNVLESFDIPLTLEPKVCVDAFTFFKEVIVPPYLQVEVRNQILDYVDYLIKRLPLYPQHEE